MEDKLTDQIEKVVSAIFASKEEDTKRKKTEDALHASADKLTTLQEELDKTVQANTTQASEIADLTEQVKTVQSEKAALDQKFQEDLANVVSEKAKVDEAFEKLNLEYSTLKMEITADKRMAELEKAGVVREQAAIQRDKVKVMSDEDFTSYCDELVAIKAQVIATLATKAAATADVVVDDAVPPANVDTTQAVKAALNLETAPSQDLLSKYKDLGNALAQSITKK
jgi:septation ring formation regulator EzrA